MSWQMKGNVLIACNCDWGCPCNFNAPPTYGDCEGGWVWAIDRGHVDSVDVSGRSVAVFADWPGAIHEGGGQASAYIDNGADDGQREALIRVLRGDLGGPWSIFINTYELDGPHVARFAVHAADHASTATIDGVAELEMEPIRNPVSGAEAHPEMVLPEGLIMKQGGLAATKIFRVHDGVSYDHSDKYAAFGAFDYNG